MDWMMTAFTIVLGCGLVLALLTLMVSWWLEEQYGAIVAKALLGYTVTRMGGTAVIVGLLLATVVWAVPPLYWRLLTLAMGGLGLVGLGGLAWLWRRGRQQKGPVLLDLGHIGKRNNQVVGGIGGLGGGLLLWGLLRLDVVWLLYGIYLLGLAMGQYVYDRAPLTITDRGVYAPEGCILWSQVQAVRWLDGTHKVAALVFKTHRIIFNQQVVRIPWDALEEVDATMAEFLPDHVLLELKPSQPLND